MVSSTVLTGYLDEVLDAFHSPKDTTLSTDYTGNPEHLLIHQLQIKGHQCIMVTKISQMIKRAHSLATRKRTGTRRKNLPIQISLVVRCHSLTVY